MINTEKKNPLSILTIPEDTKYWIIKAGKKSAYYQDFLVNNYISIEANEIKLQELFTIPHSNPSAVLDNYKKLFKRYDFYKYNNSDKEEITKSSSIKSTNRANRVFQFVEEMSVGDFVVVPHDGSTKFLIGAVISDCFDKNINHKDIRKENTESQKPGYAVSNFEIKRKVYWIKELDLTQFPEKLSWIRTARQSIFSITEYANDINPYISRSYLYKNKYYLRFSVNTTNEISAYDWLKYQTLIKDIVGNDNLKNIYQKQKVESPGNITMFCKKNAVHLLVLASLMMFGQGNYEDGNMKVTFSGVIPYFENNYSKTGQQKKATEFVKAEREYEEQKNRLKHTKINGEIAEKKAKNKLKEEENKSIKLEIEEKKLKKELGNLKTNISARDSETKRKTELLFYQKAETYHAKVNYFSLDDRGIVIDDFKLSNEESGKMVENKFHEDKLF